MEVRARFEDAPFKDFCPIRIGDRIRAVEEVGLDSLENPRSVANLLIELSEGWSMSWTLVSKHKRTRPRLFVMIYVCHAFRFANAFGTLL